MDHSKLPIFYKLNFFYKNSYVKFSIKFSVLIIKVVEGGFFFDNSARNFKNKPLYNFLKHF